MKKSQEIIGLPVFSVMDGKKIGQVKDLVLNPEEGKLDFILVSNGNWYSGARVLPYKAVMGIGLHAVTTESDSLMTNISETASAHSLLQRNIEIKGNKVLTNRGNLIGIVIEYTIDETTGKITTLEYRTAQDESVVEVIDAGQVLTYGLDVIVIKEEAVGQSPGGGDQPTTKVMAPPAEAPEKLAEPAAVSNPVTTAPVAPTPVVPAPAVPVPPAPAMNEPMAENASPSILQPAAPEPPPRPVVPPIPQPVLPSAVREEITEAEAPAPGGDGAAFFKQRQRQFLLGKKLIQDIKDVAGNLLIPEGTVVTEKVIDLAEKNNKYVELTQCVK